MSTRYVIMANGKGTRWDGHLGVPKHLVTLGGETLLQRIVRQLHVHDPHCEVIISASDPRYETAGARRHTPKVNEIELDRFPPELIEEKTCFLYGDTFYSDHAIEVIVGHAATDIQFFGDDRSIVAIQVANPELMLSHLERIRSRYLAGEITSCIGWQVYQAHVGLEFDDRTIGENFHRLDGEAAGFNTPSDFVQFAGGNLSRVEQFFGN